MIKAEAQKIADQLQKLNPDFNIRIDAASNQVSALTKGNKIELGFDQLSQLAKIAKQQTICFKRSGIKVGIYIS